VDVSTKHDDDATFMTAAVDIFAVFQLRSGELGPILNASVPRRPAGN
jgi:hypothetical protein